MGYHPSDDVLPLWLKAVIVTVIVTAILAVSAHFDKSRVMQPPTYPVTTSEPRGE